MCCENIDSLKHWVEFVINLSIVPRIVLRDLIQLCVYEKMGIKSTTALSNVTWALTQTDHEHLEQSPLPCTSINLQEKRIGIIVMQLIQIIHTILDYS